ncbi:MAG: Kelch repeat-containing protein [Planctomycetota bacterium]|jgi:hypothetical protein
MIDIQFTAVGDNGTLGTAASYDLRWSTNPIDEANWGSAQTDLTWPPSPQAAGTPESRTYSKTWGTFYFALKVTDDAGNVSALSNVAQFDPYPPGAATQFTVLPGTQEGRFILRWTTSADDGTDGASGPVSAYVIRYARTPILDDTAFNAAQDTTQIGAPWTPAAPNTTETREVELPEYISGDKFYFALKIEDDVRNLSPLSPCKAEMVYENSFLLAHANPLEPGRRSAAVVYDSKRERLIAFGGWDANAPATYFRDVLALDLKGNGMGTWRLLNPGGALPTPRWGSAAVYDPLNDRMVMFGGHDNVVAPINDLWLLDFALGPDGTWVQVSGFSDPPPVGTPTRRYGASAVYDAYRKRMILIGGGAGPAVNYSNVFALDLTPGVFPPAWTPLNPAGGFTPRWGHAAVLSPKRDLVAVFGGHFGNNQSFNDLWILNLAVNPPNGSWASPMIVGASVPPARGEAAYGFDPFNERLLVFGGIGRAGAGTTIYNDAWALGVTGGNSGAWVPLPMAVPRMWGAASCFDPINQRLVYYGGVDGLNQHNSNGVHVSLRSLEVETGWAARSAGSIIANLPRKKHGMAYDWGAKKMVIFGGDNGGFLGDTISASMVGGGNFAWQLEGIVSPPSPRRGHLMVSDSIGRRIVVFGGRNGGGMLSEVWELVDIGGTYNWINRTSVVTGTATARETAAGCFFPDRNWLVVFGGLDSTSLNAELDILDLNNLTWTNCGPQTAGGQPNVLNEAYAVYDPETGCMIVFGGDDGTGPVRNVWLLDLKGLNLSAPAPRWVAAKIAGTATPPQLKGCAGIWDGKNHRAVFFGGEDNTAQVTQGVWALYVNGHAAMKAPTPRASAMWQELFPFGATPLARSGHAMAVDPLNLRTILFGGTLGASDTNTTHELVAPTPPVEGEMENVWTPAGSRPPARVGHTAMLDRVGDRMIVFGGFLGGNTYDNNVWLLTNAATPGNETWIPANVVTLPVNRPGRRAGHSMFHWPNSSNFSFLITGGFDGAGYFRDVWACTDFNGNWGWTQITVFDGTPPAVGRAYSGCGFDWPNMQLLIVGGETPTGLTNEVWSLQLTSPNPRWTQINPLSSTGQQPLARKNPGIAMLDDSTLVMFGGEGTSGALDDAWMLINVGVYVWVRLPDAGTVPPARWGPAMFTRPGMKGAALWSGEDASGFTDFWKYASKGGSTGAFIKPGLAGSIPLNGLVYTTTVYDERNQRALVFGGRTPGGALRNNTDAIKFYQPVRR